MIAMNDVIRDAEHAVSELKELQEISVKESNALLYRMHQDAQIHAFIRCMTVIKGILEKVIYGDSPEKMDFDIHDLFDEVQEKKGLFRDDQRTILEHFFQEAEFLLMRECLDDEDKVDALEPILKRIPNFCRTLKMMIEQCKAGLT